MVLRSGCWFQAYSTGPGSMKHPIWSHMIHGDCPRIPGCFHPFVGPLPKLAQVLQLLKSWASLLVAGWVSLFINGLNMIKQNSVVKIWIDLISICNYAVRLYIYIHTYVYTHVYVFFIYNVYNYKHMMRLSWAIHRVRFRKFDRDGSGDIDNHEMAKLVQDHPSHWVSFKKMGYHGISCSIS